MSESIRVAPERTLKKWDAWRNWSTFWNWTNILVGGSAAGLAALVAANTKAHFFGEPWDWIVAAITAVLSFLVSTLAAQAKGAAFETAARELEKAITGYEMDATASVVELGKAEQRGVDILNRLKSQ
jgi:hypothetical protein